jgi:transposase InsO family protein
VEFIEPLGHTGRKKRYAQYTTIDDCTRIQVLRAYPAQHFSRPRSGSSTTVYSKLLFQVDHVQTDNGQEFGQVFHWHLLDKGIGHIKIRPRTPRLTGTVERSHHIDLLRSSTNSSKSEVIDNANLYTERLQQWEDHDNLRSTTLALAGQTPYEHLKHKAQDPLS